MDVAKVMALTTDISDLQQKLAEAEARLRQAVTDGAAGAAPVPTVPGPLQRPPGWGTITDEIMAFAASKRGGFKVGELVSYLKDRGYGGDRNAINARVHALCKSKRIKKVDVGVFKPIDSK